MKKIHGRFTVWRSFKMMVLDRAWEKQKELTNETYTWFRKNKKHRVFDCTCGLPNG